MPLPKARSFDRWSTEPPIPVGAKPVQWPVEPSPSLLMEALSRHSMLKSVGTAKITGPTRHVNRLWEHYRNFLRQAMSNFEAALGVGNRSSSLLYYYAMLNFAKAELLNQYHSQIIDQKILHGLSFNPVRAKSVAGDYLTVTPGVFSLLYERRTGNQLPIGTKLPVKRLLCAIPEIGSQVNDSGFAQARLTTIDVALAIGSQGCWILLRIDPTFMSERSYAKTDILKYFREVEAPQNWRDIFAISKRLRRDMRFLESKKIVTGNAVTRDDIMAIMDDIAHLFVIPCQGDADAFITPYLFKSKRLQMPPSLARYAVTYYASSLVRYRPAVFDADRSPEQAYLFDAVARDAQYRCWLTPLPSSMGGRICFSHKALFASERAFTPRLRPASLQLRRLVAPPLPRHV